jgi:hypothetical protein
MIHAHRAILAAGSGYFNRKLQDSEYMVCRRATCKSLHLLIVLQKNRVVTIRVDQEDSTAATTTAIKYMYGIQFPGTAYLWRSLWTLCCIGAVAEKYEIAGLSEMVFRRAHRTLAHCLSSHDDKLEYFLGPAAVWTQVSSTSAGSFAFAVRILGQKLTTVREKAPFQKLLREAPQLAIDLLNLVVEEKSELESKQKETEDSK